MARVNDVGDVVLDDIRQLRALADPDRLALFTHLQRNGPDGVDELAGTLGRDRSAVSAGLERLAGAGLVRLDGDRWQAVGRGLLLQLPEGDPEAVAAARELSSVMLLATEHLPRQWVTEAEPRLDDTWAGAAGLFNARVDLTPDELSLVQVELERVLKPYLNRPDADTPDSARRVRLLAYFLPEA